MSDLTSLGFGPGFLPGSDNARTEHVMLRRPLDRILAFTGRSIHDIVNNPLAKNQVYGFFKLQRWMDRQSEISELERTWNPLGRRT